MAPRVEYIEVRDMVPELKSRFNSGKQLNIFKAIANHPELANSWLKFADHVVGKTQTLPPRDRELVILRIGWLCQSDYEFGQHVRIGLRTGVKEDEIKKLTARFAHEQPGWAENERLLLEATDELKNSSKISDRTWSALTKFYSTRQLMDVVFAVGQYNMVSMFLNTLQVEREEGVVGFPISPSRL